MKPPSLTVAREILAHAATEAREDVAQAIRVVLDHVAAREALDQSVHGAASAITVSTAAPAATTHGTAIPPEALVDDMLPCPFCRSASLTVGVQPGSAFPRVTCGECGTRGPLARSTNNREAIANWNRRAAVAAAPAPRADTQKVACSRCELGLPSPWAHTPGCPLAVSAPAATSGGGYAIRALGEIIGYGRVMQLAEEQWRDVAGDGSELTVGPCAGLLVPCSCAPGERPQDCRWCEGARRVTQRVRNAIEALRVDDATGTMTATPRVGERHLTAGLRSLLEDLGLTPSGTGSEDLGLLELEIGRLRASRADAALVPVFEHREGRDRGDVSDVVASCEASRLVTIKEFALIDEPPGISVGYVVDDQQVKALRDRVQAQRAVAQEPSLGARVRVTAGEHAGFVGTVQPRGDDDPPGWSRVKSEGRWGETRLFLSESLAPA